MDAEERPRLAPPVEERVQVRLGMVCELYGPDRAQHLVEGVRRIGIRQRFGGDDVETVLRSLRRHGGSRGPIPLGHVVGPDRDSIPFFGQTSVRDLPLGVIDVQPAVAVLGGSVTALICAFRLDEEAGLAVHRVLAAEHRTQRLPDGSGYHPPMMTQRLAVDAARAGLRERLASWVMKVAAGEFAAAGAPLPALLLQTHRTREAEGTIDLASEWMWSVRAAEARWRSTKWPSLMIEFGSDERRDRNSLLVVGRESAVVQRIREPGGVVMDVDEGWAHTTFRLPRSFESTLMMWAALRLLAEQLSSFAELRDALADWDVHVPRAARRISALAPHARALVSSRAMAQGIADASSPYVFVGYGGNDWVRTDRDGAATWFDLQLKALPVRADDVLQEERALRERVSLEIDLLDAGAGLRAQRTALFVAVVATLLAAAALAVSAIQLQRDDGASRPAQVSPTATTRVP
jgi:hypothetical protein